MQLRIKHKLEQYFKQQFRVIQSMEQVPQSSLTFIPRHTSGSLKRQSLRLLSFTLRCYPDESPLQVVQIANLVEYYKADPGFHTYVPTHSLHLNAEEKRFTKQPYLKYLFQKAIGLASSVGFGPRCTGTVIVCQSAIPRVMESIDSFVKEHSLTCNKYSINVY